MQRESKQWMKRSKTMNRLQAQRTYSILAVFPQLPVATHREQKASNPTLLNHVTTSVQSNSHLRSKFTTAYTEQLIAPILRCVLQQRGKGKFHPFAVRVS